MVSVDDGVFAVRIVTTFYELQAVPKCQSINLDAPARIDESYILLYSTQAIHCAATSYLQTALRFRYASWQKPFDRFGVQSSLVCIALEAKPCC
jgi:hypothetical protein